jgi:hypothetical protein
MPAVYYEIQLEGQPASWSATQNRQTALALNPHTRNQHPFRTNQAQYSLLPGPNAVKATGCFKCHPHFAFIFPED